MTRKSMWSMGGKAAAWGVGAWALAGCGGAASTDERWEADGQALSTAGDAGATVPTSGAEYHCERAWQRTLEGEGYLYPDPPSFWLGSQAQRSLAVDGGGYLVLGQARGEPPARRYARQVAYAVGPDGTLQDDAGRELLGYLPTGDLTGECLSPLRVPFVSPPRATTRITIQANLDSRNPVSTFDILDPEATSSAATSISIWDGIGGVQILDIYFINQGGNIYQVSLVADGAQIAGGSPGVPTLLARGVLTFTSDGALLSEQFEPLSATFSGAPPYQAIDVDFGTSIDEGSHGLDGTTGFADTSVIFAQWQDGLPPGIGSEVVVDGWGNVHAQFDSGAALVAGRLAIARFPREAKLSTDVDGVLRETAASGEPLLGRPLDPGRGSLRSD